LAQKEENGTTNAREGTTKFFARKKGKSINQPK